MIIKPKIIKLNDLGLEEETNQMEFNDSDEEPIQPKVSSKKVRKINADLINLEKQASFLENSIEEERSHLDVINSNIPWESKNNF